MTEENVRNEKVIVELLDIAVRSAEEKAIRARRAADKCKKEVSRKLPQGWLRKAFKYVIRKEEQCLWKDGKKKNSQKKDHLESRHKKRKEEDYIKGIPISDRALGAEDREVKVTQMLLTQLMLTQGHRC